MSGPSGPHKAKIAHFDYVAGDQKQVKQKELHEENLHHKGNFEAYMGKSKLEAFNKMREEDREEEIREKYKRDPTFAATMNGHEPSRGAKTDAEILAEEAEMLRRKEEKKRRESMSGKKHKEHKDDFEEDV